MCCCRLHSTVTDAQVCCAAIQKQAAVLSEESLAERDTALNGTPLEAPPKPGRGHGSKGGLMPGAARESTYNLGVAAGLISESRAARRAQSAAQPGSRSPHWNDKNRRGRCMRLQALFTCRLQDWQYSQVTALAAHSTTSLCYILSGLHVISSCSCGAWTQVLMLILCNFQAYPEQHHA